MEEGPDELPHRWAYPVVLREGPVSRILDGFYLIIGLFCVAVGVMVILRMTLFPMHIDRRVDAWTPVFAIGAFGFAWMFLYMFHEMALVSVVLTKDLIESRGLFGRRQVQRNEIRGYRLRYRNRMPDRLIVEVKDPDRKPLRSSCFNSTRLRAWFGDIPDLDRQETKAEQEALLQDPRLGATREQRQDRLKRFRWLQGAAAVLGLAAAFWIACFPHPWRVAYSVGALSPVLAFAGALASRNVIKIVGAATSGARLGLGGLWFPPFGLAVRLIIRDPIVLGNLVAPIACVAVPCVALIFATDPKARSQGLAVIAIIAVFSAAWAFSVVATADVLLDPSAGRAYTVAVSDRHANYSGRGGPSYSVDLAPWGPMTRQQNLEGQTTYDAVRIGQTVCMREHPGLIGLTWFEVEGLRACDAPASDVDTSEFGR